MSNNDWIKISNVSAATGSLTGTYDVRGYGCIVYDNRNHRILDWEGYLAANGDNPQSIYSNSIWSFDYQTSALTLLKVDNWYNTTPGNGYNTSAKGLNNSDSTPFPRHPTYCYYGGYIYSFSGLNQNIITIEKTFTSADVDSILNIITISNTLNALQSCDEFSLSSTGTLPSPLSPNVTYFLIRDNNTQFKVATTYNNALNFSAVDITDGGSGTHTFIRTNNHPSDTWKFNVDSKNWTQVFPISGYYMGSNAISNACIADEHNKKIVIQNLRRNSNGVTGTWLFDPITETYEDIVNTNVNSSLSPNVRSASQLCYDSKRKVVWCFGGGSFNDGGNQLWKFDVANKTWTQLTVSGDAPIHRMYHFVTYITSKDVLFIYGGYDGEGAGNQHKLTDTWIYDIQNSRYVKLNPSTTPSSSKFCYGTYDSYNDQVILKLSDNGVNEWWIFKYGSDVMTNKTIRF